MGCTPYQQKTVVKNEPCLDILNLLDNTDYPDFFNNIDLEPDKDDVNIIPSFRNGLDSKDWSNNLVDWILGGDDINSQITPSTVQVTNFQESENVAPGFTVASIKKEFNANENVEHSVEMVEAEIPYDVKYKCEKSLFKVSTSSTKSQPWEVESIEGIPMIQDFSGDKNIEIMSEYEEIDMYQRLRNILTIAEQTKQINIPFWIRRYYRKLCVRRAQRGLSKSVFDLDHFNNSKIHGRYPNERAPILDRFHQLITCSGAEQARTLYARLSGVCHYEMFVSPHTGRVLHPLIHRNNQCLPQWVKLMCELQYVVNEKMPSRASVDYCYVRPQHIAAVNALLQRMFWPGIDSMF